MAVKAAGGKDPVTGVPAQVQPDGRYPESVRADVYNSFHDDNYTQELGPDSVRSTASTGNLPGGHGPGYSNDWGVEAGEGPLQKGSINDPAGNWSNNDDRYRVYYGDSPNSVYEDKTRQNDPHHW
jgi:hypothetical protein